MKNKILLTSMVALLAIGCAGCAAVKGIFNAGMGVGIFLTVLVLVIIVVAIIKLGGKK